MARLLLFSIVKYRLSTPGISRNWPRVGSPSPGRSILMTSAPNHARIWVHVGPDCTWVISRTRTPSRAFPIDYLFFQLVTINPGVWKRSVELGILTDVWK